MRGYETSKFYSDDQWVFGLKKTTLNTVAEKCLAIQSIIACAICTAWWIGEDEKLGTREKKFLTENLSYDPKDKINFLC